MKKFVTMLVMLLSFNLFAADLDWSDIDYNYVYILKDDLYFPGDHMIEKGTKYALVDQMAGGAGFPYLYMEFETMNCANPDVGPIHSDHVLVDSNGRDYRVMTRLDNNCQLSVYVHGSKLFNLSFFE